MQLLVSKQQYAGFVVVNLCGYRHPPAGCQSDDKSIGYFVSPQSGYCLPLTDGRTRFDYSTVNATDLSVNGFVATGKQANDS